MLEAACDRAELRGRVLPLAHAQEVQHLGLAHLAELARAPGLLLRPQVAPEVQVGDEVGVAVGEAAVELGGLLLLVAGPLPRVLDRQRRRDHEPLADAAVLLRLEDHPAERSEEPRLGKACFRTCRSPWATYH